MGGKVLHQERSYLDLPTGENIMTYTVRPAELLDVHYLASRLRAEDVVEIKAACGRRVGDVLRECIRSGRSWVGVDAEGPFGVFGVAPAPHESGVGVPWMLATERLEKHTLQFLRECRFQVAELQRGYRLLRNLVDARNTVHIKWLAWCGFEFVRIHPAFGYERLPFYEFQKECVQS